METTNIIKNTMEPVNDGGRKYNFIYWITGIAGGIIGLCASGVGIFLFLPLGLGAGWLIKNKILEIKAFEFRKYTFKCYNSIPFPNLVHAIIPELTRMNMTVEQKSDGSPMITHNGIMYDFSYNADQTFSLWWRKSIGGALIKFDSIKMYRNISVDMGIIAYVIQQITQSPEDVNYDNTQININPQMNNIAQTNETIQRNIMVEQPSQDIYKFCTNCGMKYKEGIMFCTNCGTRLNQ